jgi:signal transduction histidine kinase
MVDKELNFEVGSGLKNIIGSDLITDDFIAVFELVKNSFDAHAENVKIIFESSKITIIDDGKGMNFTDLKNKWLWVAYSAKKLGTEDDEIKGKEYKDYRDKIRKTDYYAGAKGIGRFSCDRLGAKLILTTKKVGVKGRLEQITTDWGKFDLDPTEKFEAIKIKYNDPPKTPDVGQFKHGTILEITSLRSDWKRPKIIELKRSLEKLINPFDVIDDEKGSSSISTKQTFSIEIKSDTERARDKKQPEERLKVNGKIKNFVFETLKLKTTQIFTEIPADGSKIITELVDRGKTIYKIEHPNPYKGLLENIRLHLYYLNHAAKINFKKSMGIPSVSFGSIFLYKNGFRVYPFGEEGEDSLGIDRRKQQGYARYLGTRELIGRIEIYGKDEEFKETTSRDGGLKRTENYLALENLFHDCLKRLENYVVDIQWKLKDKGDDLSNIKNRSGASAAIASIISRLVDDKNVTLLTYAKDLLQIINEKLEVTEVDENAYTNLESIAKKTRDVGFQKEIQTAKKQFKQLLKEKEQAENRAKEEEEARKQIEEEKKRAEEAFERERKKNLFFNATGKDNNRAALGLIHHIKLTSKALNSRIKILTRDIATDRFEPQKTLEILSELKVYSEKIQKLSEIVSYSDLNFKYAKHTGDIIKFLFEYIHEIKPGLPDVNFILNLPKTPFVTTFSILEFSIILDNLISNSIKANEKSLKIQIDVIKRGGSLKIYFSDNGSGVDDVIKNHIFDLGFTTSRGSGIGLHTAKDLMNQIAGDLKFIGNNRYLKGATFEISF